MGLFQKKKIIVSDIIKKQLINCGGKALMPSLKGKPIPFWLSTTDKGFETDKLPGYILEWHHFDELIKMANRLDGKMYREDVIAQNGAKLGEEISYDSMEGFIASEFLHLPHGSTVTRRSTYYSGILAWAGIVTVHRSTGQGSYITVNEQYRNI